MSLPSEFVCPLPWISIETTPLGTVRPCCLAQDHLAPLDQPEEPYSLKTMDLSTAYMSKSMRDLRAEFRSGAKPKTCSRCWAEESAGRTSKRMYSIMKFKNELDKIDWNNDAPEQLWFLDLKLGNLCNLKCRICGSWSSSKWAQEDIAFEKNPNKKLTRSYGMLKQGAWPTDNEQFWVDLANIMPSVKYIEFSGGEPFMVIQHFDILKNAVDTGIAGDISLHYNTNATMVPELENVWKHFKRVEIAFSIDNVGERFDFERSGASWRYVEKNIQAFKEMAARQSNIHLQSCTTINAQNAYYLPETVSWLSQQNFEFVYLNMLHDPSFMSVTNLTPAAKELILEKLSLNNFQPMYHNEITGIRTFIEQGAGSDGSAFRAFMNRVDDYRGENFVKLYPEVAKAMGYAS